jgi:hypothetical protein
MLTQAEADYLIQLPKIFLNPQTIYIPPGTDETYELVDENKREKFLLDLWRGTLRLSKVKYQTRGRKIIVLVRVDIDGSPHTNPDGTEIGGNHIHLYREGYEDKWAYILDPKKFSNPTDMRKTFEDFCRLCNIRNVPLFQSALE